MSGRLIGASKLEQKKLRGGVRGKGWVTIGTEKDGTGECLR